METNTVDTSQVDVMETDLDNEEEEEMTKSDYLPLEKDEDDLAHTDEQRDVMMEWERRKKARMVNVSTDDAEVKKDLRDLGHPICLFGEGPADRRNRLKDLLAQMGEDALKRKRLEDEERQREARQQEETTWYHEGPQSLKVAREAIALYSLPKAKARIERIKSFENVTESLRLARNQELQRRMRTMDLVSSQIADNRPISYCHFSPDATKIVTGSWSGLCKMWNTDTCEQLMVFRGHRESIGCVVFNPRATLDLPQDSPVNLASCCHAGLVNLWALNEELPAQKLEGHGARVSRVQFHPSGRFLGTCVYDNSWRLWDLERREEILHQEGHSKPVHCIAFQSDGALAATGGKDSFGRVWDLRTGQCIMFLEGHLNGIVGVDWNPDGFHVATGSMDHSLKIWDLRKRNIEYTVPAHTNIVSGVCFEKLVGDFCVTASYDNSARVWANKTWQPLATLKGHDSRLMGCDVSSDGALIATCSYDRTFKLWATEKAAKKVGA